MCKMTSYNIFGPILKMFLFGSIFLTVCEAQFDRERGMSYWLALRLAYRNSLIQPKLSMNRRISQSNIPDMGFLSRHSSAKILANANLARDAFGEYGPGRRKRHISADTQTYYNELNNHS